jgi:hypothetical protein
MVEWSKVEGMHLQGDPCPSRYPRPQVVVLEWVWQWVRSTVPVRRALRGGDSDELAADG